MMNDNHRALPSERNAGITTANNMIHLAGTGFPSIATFKNRLALSTPSLDKVPQHVSKKGKEDIDGGTTKQSPSSSPSSSAPEDGNKKQTRRKKKRWTRPSDKPKRPLSAYNMFFAHERIQLLGDAMPSAAQEAMKKKIHCATHRKISFAEMARTIGARWRALGADDKTVYEARARTLKARYLVDIKEWRVKQEREERATMTATATTPAANSNTTKSVTMMSTPKAADQGVASHDDTSVSRYNPSFNQSKEFYHPRSNPIANYSDFVLPPSRRSSVLPTTIAEVVNATSFGATTTNTLAPLSQLSDTDLTRLLLQERVRRRSLEQSQDRIIMDSISRSSSTSSNSSNRPGYYYPSVPPTIEDLATRRGGVLLPPSLRAVHAPVAAAAAAASVASEFDCGSSREDILFGFPTLSAQEQTNYLASLDKYAALLRLRRHRMMMRYGMGGSDETTTNSW